MAGSDNSPADPEEAPDREPSPPAPPPARPERRIRRPEWRRRRPAQLTPPTQAELDALAADRRLELMDLAKQRLHRRVNTWVLIGGVLATVGTLVISAQTLRTSQQGQVTDRYTKATEQLGSGKRDVRTAAIYALERIAKDSPRDRQTIRDVLATFIREHDPIPKVEERALPVEPDTDVTAALTVLARRHADSTSTPPLDLHGIRIPGITLADKPNLAKANLSRANLSRATLDSVNLAGANLLGASLARSNAGAVNLVGADLNGADLYLTYMDHSDLSHAALIGAALIGAGLADANLTGADLSAANLTGGTRLTRSNLAEAILDGADLHGAGLVGANLTGANLSYADLSSAELRGANLSGADLSGADLRDTGMTNADLIRQKATFSSDTQFGRR